MGYRLDWRLVGRENRLLDRGEIDSGFHDRHSALEALGAFLYQFAFWGRDSEHDSWWAKRSEDADLKVLISLREQMPSEVETMPVLWAGPRKAEGRRLGA
jgi:hypothetical protein